MLYVVCMDVSSLFAFPKKLFLYMELGGVFIYGTGRCLADLGAKVCREGVISSSF